MSLATIDLALRAGTMALLVLLAATLLRDARQPSGRLAAAFALGTAAYALSSAAGFTGEVTWWRVPLLALSTGNVVVFWLFARALFDDDFKPRPWHGALWAALAGLSLINCAVLVPGSAAARTLGVTLTLAALGFIALAVVQSIASWSADLVESRRRLRVIIVASAALYGGVDAVLRLALGTDHLPAVVSAADALVLAAIVAVIAFAMTQASHDDLFASAAVAAPPSVPGAAVSSDADRKLAGTLTALMDRERVYRHEGLTIGALAGRLGVPEYRLRRLINGTLGHRNFNTFLNAYRIAEAKAALADPTQAEVPVTTIALDAGFQSLGPFNRAFKTATGVTPSEFRRDAGVAATN